MKPVLALAMLLPALTPASADPYVAYVGNISVHSASREACIMVLDLAGGEPVNVSEGIHSARRFAWSPDGTKLAFEGIEEELADIFVCGPDGSDRANLTATPEVWESAPCFVGESKVAYLAGPDRSDVWLLDSETGRRIPLTDEARFRGVPVASPDGSLLAVTGSRKLAGRGHIYLVRTDGGGATPLTPDAALYSQPAFSPDGARIAFSFDGCDIGGASRGVAIVPITGGAPTLIAAAGYPLATLSFSPDGTRIAYTSSSRYHSTWVNIVNVDGTQNARLDVGRAHIIGWPSFSPDGKRLAFQGVYGAVYTVRMFDLEAGKETPIAGAEIRGVHPAFSPR